MNRRWRIGIASLALSAAAFEAHAAVDRGFSLSLFTGGAPKAEYPSRGTIYVEAVEGAPYVVRITNPLPVRVAVALSVDGLNTIDARHTDPWSARKWVLEPYGSATIPGWQVSGEIARAFYFTGERRSYGAMLGRTENLGVIEAVFFPEGRPRVPLSAPAEEPSAGSAEGFRRDAAPAAPDKSRALSDDLAATGFGERREHPVEEVAFDLERTPAAHIRVRYEFRRQLIARGVLPRVEDGLARREHASGFGEWCPER